MRAKGFDALKGMKARLSEEAVIREKEQAARLERREKAEDDRALFAAEMKRIGVTPTERDASEKDFFEKEMKRLGVVKLNQRTLDMSRQTTRCRFIVSCRDEFYS